MGGNDFRLAIPAAAVWSVTIIGLIGGRGPLLGVIVVSLVAGCAGVIAVRSGRWGWEIVGGVLLVAGMTMTAGGALYFRLDAAADHPLVARVDDGTAGSQKVTVIARIVDDPVPMEPAAAGRVRVRAQVEQIGSRRVAEAAVQLTGRTADWASMEPGQRVRVVVSVRAPPPQTTLVARMTAVGLPTRLGEPPIHQRVASMIRERLRDNSSRSLQPPESGLLPGLVVGDVSLLDRDLRDDFTAAGLSHLTAVSGANFAIVCGAVIGLCALLGAPPRLLAVMGAVVIVGFVILVRPSPSVLRAAMMGVVGLLALLRSQRSQAFPALGAAIIGGLLIWPDLALAPGFALSVAATAGIVAWSVPMRNRLRDWHVPTGLAELLALAVAAQVATAPLVALLSGTFSVVAVIANVVAAPVVGVISIVGTAAALIGALGPPDGAGAVIAQLGVRGLSPLLEWLTGCARTLGGWSWAQVHIPDGVPGALLVIVCSAVAAVACRWGLARWSP